MFGKKDTVTIGNCDKIDTLIGQGTKFKGSITATGMLRVDGVMEGDINTQGDLIVGEGGIVHAVVKARNAIVAGEIKGNVEIEEKLEILSSGKLYGDIKVNNLVIGEGAVFRGTCEMRRENGASGLQPTALGA